MDKANGIGNAEDTSGRVDLVTIVAVLFALVVAGLSLVGLYLAYRNIHK